MSQPMDLIPVLTDIVEDAAPEPEPEVDRASMFLGELEAHLTAAIHEQADELVHNACREMEALLLEQVSDRLRAQLPALIAAVMDEHFRRPDRVN
jgi:uncharacterized protein (DUF2267 family)